MKTSCTFFISRSRTRPLALRRTVTGVNSCS
jgi:hypothetical protein